MGDLCWKSGGELEGEGTCENLTNPLDTFTGQ